MFDLTGLLINLERMGDVAHYDLCFEDVIRKEGGYVLHEIPGDKGGLTSPFKVVLSFFSLRKYSSSRDMWFVFHGHALWLWLFRASGVLLILTQYNLFREFYQ